MAKEIELKLAIPDAGAASAVAQWLDRQGEPRGAFELANLYFDTPAGELARNRAALRLRRHGAQWLQTLKTAGRSEAGLAVRDEWETPVDGEALQPERLPPAAQALLAPLMARLVPVFRTDFHRRVWRIRRDGGEIEVALDRGSIVATGDFSGGAGNGGSLPPGSRSEPIDELELEWIGSDTAAAAPALRALAAELAQVAALTPSDRSKAARGYRLAGFPSEVR
ncbi:CYTH domain-containing protein [Cupriavidus sp. AU9028]|uniref:CYTH domain-containing protein n=1 Tax=Cupriavidus sp. AU9028 TaxID=2871157 RepID=UPI001C9612F4|nr:CYTH domain-containing protein [Cupriavidus sp. AU9028]MBY4898259.1 CYTH domain-containing protein [Cupriavidus sp. AU9028]